MMQPDNELGETDNDAAHYDAISDSYAVHNDSVVFDDL